jgi:hypothetical protein
MAFRTVSRLASAAVVGGVASLALAAPAGALVEPGGPGGTSGGSTGITTPAPAGTSWELLPIAVGAAGGLALAGIGFAAATGVRRRNEHMAHPA